MTFGNGKGVLAANGNGGGKGALAANGNGGGNGARAANGNGRGGLGPRSPGFPIIGNARVFA